MTSRAGVQLPPAVVRSIVRLYENPPTDVESLCEQFDIPVAVGGGPLGELEQRGVFADESGERVVTPPGEEAAERLIEERPAALARRCEHWDPDLVDVTRSLARELARGPTPELAGQSA